MLQQRRLLRTHRASGFFLKIWIHSDVYEIVIFVTKRCFWKKKLNCLLLFSKSHFVCCARLNILSKKVLKNKIAICLYVLHIYKITLVLYLIIFFMVNWHQQFIPPTGIDCKNQKECLIFFSREINFTNNLLLITIDLYMIRPLL